MVGAANLELAYLSLDRLVFYVGKIPCTAVWTGLFWLLMEPGLETVLAEVLTTTLSEARVMEYVSTDTASELFRNFVNKVVFRPFSHHEC